MYIIKKDPLVITNHFSGNQWDPSVSSFVISNPSDFASAISSSAVFHCIAFSNISFVISFLLIAIAESSFNCYLLNAFYYIYKTDSSKLTLLEYFFKDSL